MHPTTLRRPAGMAWIVALLVALLAVAGCGSDDASDDPAPAADGSATTSVDTMFGRVDVPTKDDMKVVALGWSDAEMALALGVKPIAVLDWQAFGGKTKGVGPWAADRFGDVEPTIIKPPGDGTLNYEQIDLLEPDLILNTRSEPDKKAFDRLSKIAPTVYPPKGTPAFATTWDVQMQQVAAALGKQDEGAKLIADVRGRIEQAAADHPELKGKTTASGAKFGDAYGAYLPGDGRLDLLTDLGLVNNDGIADLPANGFFATVAGEQVPVLDADVSVILPIGYTVRDVEQDDLLQSLTAVKEDRAIVLDPSTDLGDAWGTMSTISIPFVLDELVPQLAAAAQKAG
ncbi:MAG: ABC transporter substrate-binding protein [Solirubrobacteraceae bacterium]|nr:ABC transporter substrate-binding protein [Solirubrobacteraceae bacterium]